jgi:hypothetical protein
MSIGGSRNFETYILEFDNSQKRWELKKTGASRPVRVADKLQNIESTARSIASNAAPSELRIENMNGGTRERVEYEN